MLLLPGSVALSAPRFSRLSAQITELDHAYLKRAFFIYAVDAQTMLTAISCPRFFSQGQVPNRVAMSLGSGKLWL